MFNENSPRGHYEPTFTPRALRDHFLSVGISLNTHDIETAVPPVFELYWEGQPIRNSRLPKYLIATENPLINTLNRDRSYLSQFNLVFGWDTKILDLPNVVEIRIPHPLRHTQFRDWGQRSDLICMINSNKWADPSSGNDLYAERVKIIRWYERFYPADFSLWGYGWDKPSPRKGFVPKFKRNLSSLSIKLFGSKPWPSYRGVISDKDEIYRNTKFSFCYENSSNLENYVTEKIFDAMVCGCVPIYLGAPNIDKLIPSTTFIDARKYASYQDLYDFLHSITVERFCMFQKSISEFLVGEKADSFKSEVFCRTVVGKILADSTNRLGKGNTYRQI